MSGMGRAATVVSVSVLLSRVLGFLRDVFLADLLGASEQTAIYFAAFVVPDTLFYLMAGGYLSITFIPIMSRFIADGDIDGANRAFSAIAKPLALVMVTLTVLAMSAADQLVQWAFVDFADLMGATNQLTAEQLPEVARLMRFVLPAQIFFVLGSLLMAVQYTHKHFLIPALAPLIYNASIIAGGLIWSSVAEPDPFGFALGALVGSLVGNFGAQVWGARRAGLTWVSSTSFREPVVRQYFTLALPLMLGQSVAVLDEQFVRLFGNLLETDSLSQLNFARRLNMLPVGVIAQAAGVAAYPFLATLVAEGKMQEFHAALHRALKTTIVVAGAATAAVLATTQPAVRVAFERGQFDAADTQATAAALAILGWSIPLWAAHQIYGRAFYARQWMWIPVIVGTAWSIVGVAFIYPQLIAAYGQIGVPLASVLTMLGYTVTLALAWYRANSFSEVPALLATLLRVAAAAGLAGAAAWWITEAISPSGWWSSTGALLVAAVTVVGIYWGALKALRSNELAFLRR